MATLKETKGRIESVKGTLKITSAMKLVASSKLRKAQTTIENLLPYELKLRGLMLSLASSSRLCDSPLLAGGERSDAAQNAPVALAAVASNSSLCGAFNSNVIRETLHRLSALKAEGREVVLFCVGRKMADAMKRNGYEVATGDWSDLVAKADYEGCCSLADTLTKGYLEGRYSRVELIYNHFVSSARQEVRCETYLPLSLDSLGDSSSSSDSVVVDPILEPSPAELFEALLPRALKLNIYTVMLDSQAAEHAARTVAMQMATDNGQQMLSDLTLEYNKARQSKITSEILDIVGGSLQ
jgi:F-type H+-transporting ATPase subunit gamma